MDQIDDSLPARSNLGQEAERESSETKNVVRYDVLEHRHCKSNGIGLQDCGCWFGFAPVSKVSSDLWDWNAKRIGLGNLAAQSL